MEPNTAAKHTILRRYVQAWLPIMSRLVGRWSLDGRGRLLLLDGFCGPGRYIDGEDRRARMLNEGRRSDAPGATASVVLEL
jgi:three-Cys-motif partner protein